MFSARSARPSAGSSWFAKGAWVGASALNLSGILHAEVFVPRLVKDINTTPLVHESNPFGFGEYQGKAIFTAGEFVVEDNAEGARPVTWATDGTAAGTMPLESPVPGLVNWDPRAFVSMGGSQYFGAFSSLSTDRLWKTDGSAAGTSSLGNLPGVTFPGVPRNLIVAGNLFYFSVTHASNQEVVWRSDGTAAGTFPLNAADVSAAPIIGAFHSVDSFIAMGDEVYFVVGDDELWKSSGTPASTVRVDLPDQGLIFDIRQMVVLDDALYLIVQPFNSPTRLVKTGGTPATTEVIGGPGTSSTWTAPTDLRVWNNALYFTAVEAGSGRELWRSDGTSNGSTLVKDIQPGSGNSAPRVIATTPGWMYLRASTTILGAELWRSDGTAQGTYLLKDLNKGSASGTGSDGLVIGGKLFFEGEGKNDARTLCTSDGTEKGTRIVKVFSRSSMEPNASMGRLGNLCLFSAGELWKSDGTPKGTVLLKDLNTASSDGIHSDLRVTAEVINGTYVFAGNTRIGNTELWRSDGTAKGTMQLKDMTKPPGEGSPYSFVLAGERVWFKGFDRAARETVWSTDGHAKGTRLEPAFPPLAPYPNNFFPDPEDIVTMGGQTYFLASGRLYQMQGGQKAPVLLKEGMVDTFGKVRPQLAVMGGSIYLGSKSIGFSTTGLWKSGGTPGSTVEVKSLSNPPEDPVVFDNSLYFLSGGLWKSDGTEAGTVEVAEPAAAWENLIESGGRLYFFGKVGASERQLWTSDGTEAGTVMIKSFPHGVLPSAMPWGQPVAAGERIYFVMSDGTRGAELWTSDGSPGGTIMLRDIAANTGSSSPTQLEMAGDLLFFSANDGVHGRELWRSDGTEAGTVMVADLWPGVSSGAPQGIRGVGSKLFFSVHTPAVGRELWVMDLPAAASATITHAGGGGKVESMAGGVVSLEGQALLRYAFNVDPEATELARLVPGSGTFGFPQVSSDGKVLRVEYLRRKNAGLSYTPKYSTSLAPESFVPMNGKVSVTVIDEEWERVVAEQAYDPAVTRRIFALVEVVAGE